MVILTQPLSSLVIYEPFAGSGSAAIAAERLKRTCYGIEIEPKYCDSIIARWEKFSGMQACHHRTIE